jgi:hypothetical protein
MVEAAQQPRDSYIGLVALSPILTLLNLAQT